MGMGSEEIDHGSARNSTEGEGEGATRASDEELARQSYDAYPDIAIAGNIVAWYYLLSESQKRHIARAAAVRARVEAPLLAEIAELRGEVSRIRGIADTFCVERNNVMKERDCIKSELTASQARVAELEAMGVPNDHCITCGGITDEGDALVWQHERCAENVRLRAELEAVKAERDGQLSAAIKMSGELQNTQMCRDEALKALEQLAALRQRDAVPVKVRSGVTGNDALIFWTENDCEDSMHTFIDYILENAVIAAPAGVPSVQELIPAVGTALSIPHDEKFSPYSERGWEYTRAVRARVEAPLLAEIERLKSEPTGDVAGLRAKIENQRMTLRQLHEARERDAVERMKLESEFVSVTAERDKDRAELAASQARVAELEAEMEPHIHILNTLRAELEAVKAQRVEGEGGRTIPGLWKEVGFFIEIDDSIRILPGEKGSAGALVSFHNAFLSTCQERIAGLEVALAEIAELHPGETVEGVIMERDGLQVKHIESLEGFKQMRDHLCATNEKLDAAKSELAAVRQRDAVPVDPDAWKTDLVVAWLKFREAGRQIILVDNTQAMGALGSLSAADAARASLWLASYAAAHGCPAQHAVIDAPAGVPSVEELTHDEIAQAIHDSDLARVPSTNKDLSDRIHPHRQADAVLDLLRAKGLVSHG